MNYNYNQGRFVLDFFQNVCRQQICYNSKRIAKTVALKSIPKNKQGVPESSDNLFISYSWVQKK